MATDPEAIPREALPRQSGAARAWRVLRAARPARTGPGMDRAAAWPASAGSGPSGRALILAVATIFALVVTLVGATLRYDRERRVQNAHDQAATLARVLEEQTASVLWAADVSLLGIAETLRRQPGLAAHDPAFEDSLRRVRNQVPAIRALFVIGADGFITQDTDRHTPHRNLADRDYFRAHLEGPDRGMFVGQPLVSRSVDTWFVGLSRRVETPAGAIAGVAAAAVDARYFESFYEDLGLRSGDVITLATRDGVLVARQPRADDRVGQPLVGAEGQNLLLDALARGRGGTFEKPSEIDGRPRIFGYRAIEGRPLVVLVGLPQDRVLASWYQGVAVATAATLAVMAFGIFVVWLAMRHSRREAAARQRLDEAATLEALGRLTGGVAHDFNNLLQALVSALRLLRSGPADGARAQRIIEHGLAAADRGRRQVAELLRIARWRDTRPREVDVNALLGEMTALLRGAASPGARVELDLAEDLHRCRADPARLDAAILNLVVNAREALPPDRDGQGVIRISTANCREPIVSNDARRLDPGRFISVSVQDDGAGMPPEVRRRALEPFFTSKGESGAGIGLPQIHAFVRELGGDMQIESGPGAGTRVSLYLPRA